MGWRQFIRERLTSADVQSYLMDQAVLSFPSVAARDAAIAVGARKAGMVSVTTDTGTYWGCTANSGTWRVLGQIGAPVTVPVNTGWTAGPAGPRVAFSGANRAALFGTHANNGAFTANGTQYPLTLPTDYRPATNQVFTVPWVGGGTGGILLSTLLTDGRLRYDGHSAGATTVPASSAMFLDAVNWHLTA